MKSDASKTRVAFSAFLFFSTSLVLSALSARYPAIGSIGIRTANEVLRPILSSATSVSDLTSNFKSRLAFLRKIEEENTKLRSSINHVQDEVVRLREVKSENRRLRRLLKYIEREKISGIAARVIGIDPSSWVRAITLDKGESHGLEVDRGVVDGRAVVGRIVSTSSNTSKVLLIIDSASGIDSLIQRTRAPGVLLGLGQDRELELRYVPKDSPVQVGDKIVTSGLGGVFPKGLDLGTVRRVKNEPGGLFQEITVKPTFYDRRIEEVLVLDAVKKERVK